MNSRPGRYSSTRTGWRNFSSSRTQTLPRSSGDSMRECSSTPLPVPSARGLANSGSGRSTALMSSDDRTTQNRGVCRPADWITRLVMALSSVSAQTSGSEKVYGIPYISNSAGTWASRLRPDRPSAKLKTRSHRLPAASCSRAGPGRCRCARYGVAEGSQRLFQGGDRRRPSRTRPPAPR